MVESYKCFEGICCLHLQDVRISGNFLPGYVAPQCRRNLHVQSSEKTQILYLFLLLTLNYHEIMVLSTFWCICIRNWMWNKQCFISSHNVTVKLSISFSCLTKCGWNSTVVQFDVKCYFRVTATMLQIRCSHCPRSKASLSLEPHRRTTPALGGELGGVKHSFTQHQTLWWLPVFHQWYFVSLWSSHVYWILDILNPRINTWSFEQVMMK
jgi:hypothetical protein